MKESENQSELTPYNKVVKEAYYRILKNAKSMLATLERDELRYSLERESMNDSPGNIIHEIVNPLLYLRLECYSDNQLGIHFGIEQALAINQYSDITASFIRVLFAYTSSKSTEVNIEKAVRTDWVITTCSVMYEHVEENNKYHTFSLIKHKPKAIRRKLQIVA